MLQTPNRQAVLADRYCLNLIMPAAAAILTLITSLDRIVLPLAPHVRAGHRHPQQLALRNLSVPGHTPVNPKGGIRAQQKTEGDNKCFGGIEEEGGHAQACGGKGQ